MLPEQFTIGQTARSEHLTPPAGVHLLESKAAYEICRLIDSFMNGY